MHRIQHKMAPGGPRGASLVNNVSIRAQNKKQDTTPAPQGRFPSNGSPEGVLVWEPKFVPKLLPREVLEGSLSQAGPEFPLESVWDPMIVSSFGIPK